MDTWPLMVLIIVVRLLTWGAVYLAEQPIPSSKCDTISILHNNEGVSPIQGWGTRSDIHILGQQCDCGVCKRRLWNAMQCNANALRRKCDVKQYLNATEKVMYWRHGAHLLCWCTTSVQAYLTAAGGKRAKHVRWNGRANRSHLCQNALWEGGWRSEIEGVLHWTRRRSVYL